MLKQYKYSKIPAVTQLINNNNKNSNRRRLYIVTYIHTLNTTSFKNHENLIGHEEAFLKSELEILGLSEKKLYFSRCTKNVCRKRLKHQRLGKKYPEKGQSS